MLIYLSINIHMCFEEKGLQCSMNFIIIIIIIIIIINISFM